jgi:RNA polymerase sigma-70 factor (ECF subfamily)
MSDDLLTELAIALQDPREDATGFDRAARDQLARFCRGYLGDDDGADDAVQEVLERASAARTRARPESPRAWLLAIARNHCIDVLRARDARPDRARLATSFDAALETAGPITRLVQAERESELAAALASLSADERELLRLRYAEDLSRAEVATVLATTEDLVKSRLYEAIEKLRHALHAGNARDDG